MVEGVRVRVGPHCSGVIPKGCPHKFHHIAEQNVIGSARIVCLCLRSRSENRSTFLLPPKLYVQLRASKFSYTDYFLIEHTGHENKGDDHQ